MAAPLVQGQKVGRITYCLDGASVAEDAGCASIARKLQLGGKVVIFLMSMSVVAALVDIVGGLIDVV